MDAEYEYKGSTQARSFGIKNYSWSSTAAATVRNGHTGADEEDTDWYNKLASSEGVRNRVSKGKRKYDSYAPEEKGSGTYGESSVGRKQARNFYGWMPSAPTQWDGNFIGPIDTRPKNSYRNAGKDAFVSQKRNC